MTRILGLLACALWLTGCASGIKDANLTKTSKLGPQDGMVAIQVINNAERLSGYHDNWTSVYAVRVDNMKALKQAAIAQAKEKASARGKTINEDDVDWDPEMYSMNPIGAGAIGSQLFVGTMPAGEYIISSLYAYYSDGNMSSWLSMKVGYEGGTFVVKPHEFANLGSVVFQPLKSIRQDGFWASSNSQRAYVTRLPHVSDLRPFVQTIYPQAAAQLAATSTSGWKADELDSFRRDLAGLSRGNVLLTDTAAQQGNASLFGKLGQLRQLQQGRFQAVDLPTNGQIGAVLHSNDFTLVGAEQGEMFFRANTDSQWQTLRPVPANEAVIGLAQSGQDIFALTRVNKAIKVYRTTKPTDVWQAIGSFPTRVSSSLVAYGDAFLIAIPGGVRVFNDVFINDFAIGNGQWSTGKSRSLIRMADLGSGVLLGLESSSWDGVGDTLYSADYGKSWSVIDRSSSFWVQNKFEFSLPVRSGDQLVLIDSVAETTTVDGKPQKTSSLRLTSKAIANMTQKGAWQAHGKAIAGCEILLPELSDAKRIYALCEYGKVISTADMGASWQTDINVNIEGMQSKQTEFLRKLLEELQAKEAAASK